MMRRYDGHTEGPWRWEVNPKGRHMQLCGGRQPFDLTVMDFVRWGMSGAQPRVLQIAPNGMELMRKAEDFKVIDPKRHHHAHWFQLIDHPDMNLMADAPMILEERDSAFSTVEKLLGAMKAVENMLQNVMPLYDPEGDEPFVQDVLQSVLSRARGTLPVLHGAITRAQALLNEQGERK